MPPANPTPLPLDDGQLDRLETLLEAPELDDAMRLDEIQGYLCAALAGPRPIDVEDRLADMLGSAEAVDSEAGQEAAGLIRQFSEALAAQLADGDLPTLLLYPKDENGEGPYDYLPWCHAYLAGVDLADDDWFDCIGALGGADAEEQADYLDERLFPLLLLSGEMEAIVKKHNEAWPKGDERAALEKECQDDMPYAVAEIYRFWLAKRGIGTIRESTAKVGRNAPCPCGSGKKFKQCCGGD
ncbi:MAG: UPF0149 family protein [Candidatus Accumulibacter sp.]|nr:UPF0149 family protein [Accumulibacter sp.]